MILGLCWALAAIAGRSAPLVRWCLEIRAFYRSAPDSSFECPSARATDSGLRRPWAADLAYDGTRFICYQGSNADPADLQADSLVAYQVAR